MEKPDKQAAGDDAEAKKKPQEEVPENSAADVQVLGPVHGEKK